MTENNITLKEIIETYKMQKPFIYSDRSEFKDIVRAVDDSGIGVVIIIDSYGKIVGIVTDGDIRKSILKGKYNMRELINTDPVIMNYQTSQREIISKLKNIHRRHMPLVDDERNYKGVFSLDDIEFISKENKVVIMAGGLGSRLGELTKNTPKPMLHVGKKPMLQHLLENFSDHGYKKFVISVNYKKEVIKEYFKNGAKFGVEIQYLEEDFQLGTAGALSLLDKKIEKPFFVVNGDILTTIDFDDLLDFHMNKGSLATMCVRPYSYQVPFGVVNANDNGMILSIEEKPSIEVNVNAGVYLLNPEVLEFVPKDNRLCMPDLFEKLISEEKITNIYQVNEYWMDVGRIEDYYKANEDISF